VAGAGSREADLEVEAIKIVGACQNAAWIDLVSSGHALPHEGRAFAERLADSVVRDARRGSARDERHLERPAQHEVLAVVDRRCQFEVRISNDIRYSAHDCLRGRHGACERSRFEKKILSISTGRGG